ncbi:hypothetical protein [Vannielia sp.]|uniref:hypothetical protein n=1 Tax=Vannielia sp. TaxID=2813045 RepID=UPI00260EAB88|nr:hypothetical protein [Vannielia sp.]MDF1872486.1 hypothetical protein [Vannielia sp.]
MRPFIALVIALTCATPALAEMPPWAGHWAAEPAWCANQTGTTPQAPIYLADTEFRGYENTCDIISAAPLAAGDAWDMHMQCVGEGQEYEIDAIFMVEDGKTLFWWDQGFMGHFTRCP